MTLVPYKRIGEPIDIARAAVWLASDDSDYVVGATLFVDGDALPRICNRWLMMRRRKPPRCVTGGNGEAAGRIPHRSCR